MKRALVMPVSAAVVGALLAIGVSSLVRSTSNRVIHISGETDALELVSEFRMQQDEVVREALEAARAGLQEALEGDRRLTEEQRERLQAAMERLDSRLEGQLKGMDGVLEVELQALENLELVMTPEDGAAHADAAPEASPSGN